MTQTEKIIGVLLAGGRSSRMQGARGGSQDKAELMLGARRLVDHVYARLSPQVPEVIFSGEEDYGLGLPSAPDLLPGYKGPLAGLHGALTWVAAHRPDATGVLTMPVDAPFAPADLARRLLGGGEGTTRPILAETQDGPQPTFGYWPVSVLPVLDAQVSDGEAGALRHFASKMLADYVMFADAAAFTNINTPEQFDAARQRLLQEGVA